MEKSPKTTNYAFYGRKSSEADDRQVLSIESQLADMCKVMKRENVTVSDDLIFKEAMSAKQSDRPIFNQMLEKIKQEKIQGIVCWKLDRLARNLKEGGELMHLLSTGKIKQIITYDRNYLSGDNVFLSLFEFGIATQFSKDLSVSVRRGFRTKYEMGHLPGLAKLGYINVPGRKGERVIGQDPERFDLVKQLWQRYLKGGCSVRQLLEYSDKELGIKTIQRGKEGGKPIQLSMLYTMLRTPFYAGFFYGKDGSGEMKRYEVHPSLPRMITEEQYHQVQVMLRGKGHPCPSVNKNFFAYTGKTKCGTCEGSVTAENKYQLICSKCRHKFCYRNREDCSKCGEKIDKMKDPKYLHYIYYHCTKKKNSDCPEGSVQEKDMDEYAADYFGKNIQISRDLKDWCLQHLNELEKNDQQNEFEVRSSFERQKEEKEKEVQELIKMKTKGFIDDKEFISFKSSLKVGIESIDKNLAKLGKVGKQDALDKAKRVFELSVGIAEVFRNGEFKNKTEVLLEFGSNLTLKDKKLSILNKKLVGIIINGVVVSKSINPAFEPENYQSDKEKTEVFASVRSALLPESVQNLSEPINQGFFELEY